MTIYLEIEVERSTGKFASKDEIIGLIMDLVDGQSLQGDEGGVYDVTSVSAYDPPRPKKATQKPEARPIV